MHPTVADQDGTGWAAVLRAEGGRSLEEEVQAAHNLAHHHIPTVHEPCRRTRMCALSGPHPVSSFAPAWVRAREERSPQGAKAKGTCSGQQDGELRVVGVRLALHLHGLVSIRAAGAWDEGFNGA